MWQPIWELLYKRRGVLSCKVYSRTEESASALAARLSVDYTIVPDEIRRDADLYIVALKDAVLRQLAPVLVEGREQALFVHTAGSMSMDLWKGLVKRYGVLYPMQTFSKQREVDFNTVPFLLEASAPAEVELLRMVAVRLSPKVYEVTSGQRRYCIWRQSLLVICKPYVCIKFTYTGKAGDSF